MFQALEAFRGQLKGLTVAINFAAGGKQFVMVTPTLADDAKTKNPELAQPFSFTATPAELDAEFASSIGMLAGERKSLADQVAEQAAALKTKAASTATKPGLKKTATVAIDDEQELESTTVAEPVAVASATVVPAAGTPVSALTADNLFE